MNPLVIKSCIVSHPTFFPADLLSCLVPLTSLRLFLRSLFSASSSPPSSFLVYSLAFYSFPRYRFLFPVLLSFLSSLCPLSWLPIVRGVKEGLRNIILLCLCLEEVSSLDIDTRQRVQRRYFS